MYIYIIYISFAKLYVFKYIWNVVICKSEIQFYYTKKTPQNILKQTSFSAFALFLFCWPSLALPGHLGQFDSVQFGRVEHKLSVPLTVLAIGGWNFKRLHCSWSVSNAAFLRITWLAKKKKKGIYKLEEKAGKKTLERSNVLSFKWYSTLTPRYRNRFTLEQTTNTFTTVCDNLIVYLERFQRCLADQMIINLDPGALFPRSGNQCLGELRLDWR